MNLSQDTKNILGLQLPTDPRWVNLAELSLSEILTDHAYCEQKAATSCISLIQAYPEKTELVAALALDVGSLCDAAKGGRKSRVHRTRAARGIAPIGPSGHGWPVGPTRPPVANRRAAPARHRGCVLFGYFLLHKQEKVTRRPGWPVRQTRTSVGLRETTDH